MLSARLRWCCIDMLYSNINVNSYQIVHDMIKSRSKWRKQAIQYNFRTTIFFAVISREIVTGGINAIVHYMYFYKYSISIN